MSDALAASADELREEVARLRLAVQQLDRRTKRAELVTSRVVAAIVVLLVLLGLVGWSVAAQVRTAERLGAVVELSLCPTFALVLGGYNPESRPPGEARDRYERSFSVMRDAYTQLGCTSPLVPPRTPGS